MPFPCKRGGGGRDEDGSWIPPGRQTFCLKVGFEVTGGGGGGYKHWAAWSGSHKDRARVSHEPAALLVSEVGKKIPGVARQVQRWKEYPTEHNTICRYQAHVFGVRKIVKGKVFGVSVDYHYLLVSQTILAGM